MKMNRREFLGYTGAIGAVAAAGPFIHIADAQAATPTVPYGWSELIKFKPGQYVRDRISDRDSNTWLHDWYLQPIEDGVGNVNLDYYPLEMSRLPTGWTPERFLREVRANLNSFCGTIINFHGYDNGEGQRWSNDQVLGTFMNFEEEASTLAQFIPNIFAQLPGWIADYVTDLIVVGAEESDRHWRFSTVHVPVEKGFAHAVNGNREFGIKQLWNGNWEFYIQGADRVNPTFNGFGGPIFAMGDTIWTTVIQNMSQWVVNQGGSLADGGNQLSDSEVRERRYSQRHNWQDVKTQVGF